MARLEKQVLIKRKHGLHARPATLFVQLANKFDSSVKVKAGKETIDAKSIIAILSLGLNKDAKITIIAEGEDAKEALGELANFIEEEE
ncbi:MAG: HPr family phosphocarrier protein [Candidatus Omnitrophica bacterium]|jgi:phosphocarrier protein|nr:HPr family phosphocarrier protein [Candidatus Omnitrophota bacterium]MCF7891558.1 HPr family phosphocarrier protein [Candidatus Omnitrophota bacterium]MCF7895763.1 HPr family phosphocarrier protein [Candidatus Omnitrophota bacterium]MCF7897330.1 HPr family phosphocarrier protein [Candidatus Omnitrophota bacterium]MCF7909700.1 HPr family phosphocarrier protein [Candidatus Omnitrophota bacterium]